jgi:hypothetical protein
MLQKRLVIILIAGISLLVSSVSVRGLVAMNSPMNKLDYLVALTMGACTLVYALCNLGDLNQRK